MSNESPQYERLVRVKGVDGETRLVRESEVASFSDSRQVPETPDIPRDYRIRQSAAENGEKVDQKRRTLLGGILGMAAGAQLLRMSDTKRVPENTEVTPRFNVEPTQQNAIERLPLEPSIPEKAQKEGVENLEDLGTPREQLEKYGRIQNLAAGIRAYEAEHKKRLTETESGQLDMRTAVGNMRQLNMQKFVQPFEKRGLPQNLAYMIAIQESRGRVNTISWAGAHGITGIMPATARLLGFGRKDSEKINQLLRDPYVTSELSARHLAADREIFGDNTDMLLHSYNGGANLFGFTESVPKEERTSERFYAYMEEYLNKKFESIREHGWYPYRIQKGDTLSKLSDKYNVSLKKILEVNDGLYRDTVLRIGDTVRIPIRDVDHALDVLFRSEFEVLHYAPEMRAKYEAIKELGLLPRLEASLKIKTSSFG